MEGNLESPLAENFGFLCKIKDIYSVIDFEIIELKKSLYDLLLENAHALKQCVSFLAATRKLFWGTRFGFKFYAHIWYLQAFNPSAAFRWKQYYFV